MKIQGPLVTDQSKWDDHLNITELKNGGVVSVILGLYKKWDRTLNANCRRIATQIIDSGMLFQAYFYYYPQLDPIKEAEWVYKIVTEENLPVKFFWADLEDSSAVLTQTVRSERHRLFVKALDLHFPGKVGVYTNKSYITARAPKMDEWLPQYRAWVPHWGYQPIYKYTTTWEDVKARWLPNYDIILSKGQLEENVVGHQFTGDRFVLPGTYNAYGKRLPVDISVFDPDFIEELGGVIPPTPVPDYSPYITLNNVNIRSTPSTYMPVVMIVPKGTTLLISNTAAIQNGYAQMINGNWVYVAYISKIRE